MSPWKSRWSWLRFVKTSASKRTRSRRWSDEACEDASSAHAAVAGVEHLAEGSLEVDRLRASCGTTGRALAADPRLDRAEQPRAAAGGVEDGMQQEGGRRLAVRPRDAGDLELPRRLAEERVGRDRHGGPRVGHDELRNGRRRGGRSTTSATAPLSTACPAKSWPSARSPRHAEEQRAALDRRASYARSRISTGRRSTISLGASARMSASSSIAAQSTDPSQPPAVPIGHVRSRCRRGTPAHHPLRA